MQRVKWGTVTDAAWRMGLQNRWWVMSETYVLQKCVQHRANIDPILIHCIDTNDNSNSIMYPCSIKMTEIMYLCSIKTREVLENPSPTRKIFPETQERYLSYFSLMPSVAIITSVASWYLEPHSLNIFSLCWCFGDDFLLWSLCSITSQNVLYKLSVLQGMTFSLQY